MSLLALNSTPKQKKKKGVKITCSSPKSLNPKFNKNIREKSNYLCKLNLNPSYGESIIMMPLVGTLLGEGGGEVGQWTKQEEIRGVSCWPPNQGMKFWECERSLNIFNNTQSVHVACGLCLCLRLWAAEGLLFAYPFTFVNTKGLFLKRDPHPISPKSSAFPSSF